MAEYIGLEVIIDLLDGRRIEGVIEDVSPSTNILTLHSAVVDGRAFKRLELIADQISNITIIENPSSKDKTDMKKNLHLQNATPTKNIAAPRQGNTPRKKGGIRPNEWSDTDVARYQETEFDIQGSLHRFDKQKIFSEIREKDRTRPEDRLISHNLSQRKLTPQQRVLDQRVENDDFDEILVGTSNMSLEAGSATKKEIPVSKFAQISSQMESSRRLRIDQMVEIGACSLFRFVIDTYGLDCLQRGIFFNIQGEMTEALVVSSARHFLNRNVKVYLKISNFNAFPSMATIVDQMTALGAEMVNSVPRQYSLAFTSFPLKQRPREAIICGLDIGIPDCQWNIQFGAALSPITGNTVVCDVGWSPRAVSDMYRVKIDRVDYFSKGNCYLVKKK